VSRSRWFSRLRRGRSRFGGNAVEFALVATPLVGMLTGVMDYGWYYAHRHAAHAAAAEGARVGALTPQTGTPVANASTAAQDKWDGIGLPSTITITAGTAGVPQQMVVVVDVTHPTLIGFVPQAGPISARAIKQMEDQP
jgi:Flp pilus assembly protein TadG